MLHTVFKHPVKSVALLGLLTVTVTMGATFLMFKILGIESFIVSGTSMEPTFKNGDIVYLKTTTAPERGQVAVFRPPVSWGKQPYYTKRVLAVPGDVINYSNNSLTINGGTSQMSRSCANDFEITVPPNKYFMQGDNSASNDSFFSACKKRDPVFVDRENIIFTGSPLFRFGDLTWPK